VLILNFKMSEKKRKYSKRTKAVAEDYTGLQ
jgi:hypothetical protein